MDKFISKYDVSVLSIKDIVRSVYKEDKKNKLNRIDKIVSSIKTRSFKDFSKKLKNISGVSFDSENIFTHEISVDDKIIPDRYLSAGANGITFLANLKKDKKGNKKVIVKYEIIRDRDYEDCQNEYIECIDKYKDKVNMCKVREVYCRLESAFDEIYINKNHIQYLNSPNFAMFYAFFMCPTYTVMFEKDKKTPSQEFIQKYIENKNFCPLTQENESIRDSDKMHVFSVYEYIKGKTLYDYILSWSFNINTFYEIILQIFGALSIAQIPEYVYYNHNDLHCKNIMIETYPDNNIKEFVYKFPCEKTLNKVKSNKRAVIIDQGSASLLYRDKKEGKYSAVFGWYKKKVTKIIRNFNSPYADIYRFLTYSYYLMSRRYDQKKEMEILKNHINALFSLDGTQFSTICTDFIDNENEVWFDNYYTYLQENLSKELFSNLIKKIEKITYEDAYNYFYYNFE